MGRYVDSKIPVKHILAMTGIGLSGVFVYLVALQIGYSVMPGQQAFVINYLCSCHDHHMGKIFVEGETECGEIVCDTAIVPWCCDRGA